MSQKENKVNVNKESWSPYGTVQIIHKDPDMKNQMPKASSIPPPPKPQK